MPSEQVLVVNELVAKKIILQGDLEFVINTERQTSGGIVFKDSVGFTIARIDSSGNLHIRGNVLKDL